MNQNTLFVTEMQIGDTLYIIEHSRSDTATETVESKLKRLILTNTDRCQNKAAA